HALHRHALIRETRRNVEPIDIAAESLFLLQIRDCRAKDLGQLARDDLARELQRRERLIHALAANEIADEAGLLRRGPNAARGCVCFNHLNPPTTWRPGQPELPRPSRPPSPS